VHIPSGKSVLRIDRPDRGQALRILRPRPACGEDDTQDCRQRNAPCPRATLHLSYLRREDFGARGEDRKGMRASSSATRPVAGPPADFKPVRKSPRKSAADQRPPKLRARDREASRLFRSTDLDDLRNFSDDGFFYGCRAVVKKRGPLERPV